MYHLGFDRSTEPGIRSNPIEKAQESEKEGTGGGVGSGSYRGASRLRVTPSFLKFRLVVTRHVSSYSTVRLPCG